MATEPEPEHPTKARRGPYPEDALLRFNGRFEIHSRPVRGPAIWRRRPDGEFFTAEAALEMLRRLAEDRD